MSETEFLDNELSPSSERRRKLLPTWIKVFLWIFMVFGAIAPIALIAGILGYESTLSLYGLEATTSMSITGILIILFYGIKGAVSIGLWTEKDWAVDLAMVDAVIGIVTCVIVMVVFPFIFENQGFAANLRIELIILIPYLLKMNNIRSEWRSRSETA